MIPKNTMPAITPRTMARTLTSGGHSEDCAKNMQNQTSYSYSLTVYLWVIQSDTYKINCWVKFFIKNLYQLKKYPQLFRKYNSIIICFQFFFFLHTHFWNEIESQRVHVCVFITSLHKKAFINWNNLTINNEGGGGDMKPTWLFLDFHPQCAIIIIEIGKVNKTAILVYVLAISDAICKIN